MHPWAGLPPPAVTHPPQPPHAQQAQRDLLIYVSRSEEPTRRVANEEALLAGGRPAGWLHPAG